MTYLEPTPNTIQTLARNLSAHGHDRFVIQSGTTLFSIADPADAVKFLTSDTAPALLYAANEDGEMTLVGSWGGSLIFWDTILG